MKIVAFLANWIFYVILTDLKVVLANFRHWEICRHCFWTQNDKFLLKTLHDNL